MTRIQDDGEPLGEFATAIEWMNHRAFPALCEDHVHMGNRQSIWRRNKRPRHKTAVTSGNREKCRGPQTDPRDEGRKADSLVFHRAPENEWQDIMEEPTPSQRRDYRQLMCRRCTSTATFGSSVLTNQKKCRLQHDDEVLFARVTIEVTVKSPWRRK
jgi:hypothetical protein